MSFVMMSTDGVILLIMENKIKNGGNKDIQDGYKSPSLQIGRKESRMRRTTVD